MYPTIRSLTFAAALAVAAGCDSQDRTPDASQAQRADSPPAQPAGMQEEPNREKPLVHLPLAAFPELPESVKAALSLFNCTVPQAFFPETPHNVISGHFAAPGQLDWAVLCSARDSSSIVVVWGGEVKCASRFATSPDGHWGQNIGDGVIGYSRAIGTADINYILEHARALGGPAPPARDHDGINDAFVEKASTVFFCHDGNWVQLQGAD